MKGVSDFSNSKKEGKMRKDTTKHLDEITANPTKIQEELLMKILQIIRIQNMERNMDLKAFIV